MLAEPGAQPSPFALSRRASPRIKAPAKGCLSHAAHISILANISSRPQQSFPNPVGIATLRLSLPNAAP